jgi:hypothetical protein
MMRKLDIISTDLGPSGEIRIKLGDGASGIGEYDNAAQWSVPGFFFRPKPHDTDGACQAIVNVMGSNARIIAARDNRIVAKYGTLNEGDSCLVSYGDAGIFIKEASDSVTIITKNHAANDETILFQLNGKTGEITMMAGGSQGTALLKVKSGRVVIAVDNGGATTWDSQGVHVMGNTFDCATGGGNLGVLGPIPPPPGTFSILAGPMGQVGQPSTKWTVAT